MSAQAIFNFARKLYEKRIPLVPKLLKKYLRVVYSCDLPPSVVCKGDLKLAHNGLGVVIHPRVTLGEGCKVYQNVTIGESKSSHGVAGGYNGVPSIGNHVLIYAGAVVIGDIQIGNNVIIGANAVVTKSIPDDCVAVGVPATYKKREMVL